ncbi:class II glutamine amidotransferase [Candidatus Dojkabacteria bacterium]|jgi:glucosamine 6-phosphate synthetase-like amidotransferase/phosphosugar isomerase protein|nr:class II glutamine amidotransferase [Candidatus Dojkabacteria bacterium]
MCGIAGVITKKGVELNEEHLYKRRKIFTGLLVAMQERGNQSAGVAFIDKNKLAIVKAPISAVQFINNPRFKKLMQKNFPLIIGHTRFATMGVVNKRNSHPFLRGNIVGVHNGHVSNVKDFERFNKSLEVDSELIFNLLNESNNNYIKTFKKLKGYFAIAWTKMAKDDYELFLVKDNNPLYIAYVKELKSYFYCSTEEALQTILLSHYSKVKVMEIPESAVIDIKSDLSMIEEKITFKDYGSGTWGTTNHTESYNKRYGGYGEDEFDFEDKDGLCGSCHQSLKNCQCELPTCDDCGQVITTVYYITDKGNILCFDCYDYKRQSSNNKLKGTKYAVDF